MREAVPGPRQRFDGLRLMVSWLVLVDVGAGEHDIFKIVGESFPYARYMSYQVPTHHPDHHHHHRHQQHKL